jgi:hypothetical protein
MREDHVTDGLTHSHERYLRCAGVAVSQPRQPLHVDDSPLRTLGQLCVCSVPWRRSLPDVVLSTNTQLVLQS